MKRILNIYSVFRHVRKYRDPNADAFDDFAKKLLKSVIISEQWPFPFAWILQVISKIQREHLLLKERADNSTILSKRFSLSKNLQYDVSKDEGWDDFCNESIFNLFLKIEAIILPASNLRFYN